MANKTTQSDESVEAFIQSIADEKKRQDSHVLIDLMREATGDEPTMWGPAIIGFGKYRYKYESGRTGDWFHMGFSPRKAALTLYLNGGVELQTDLLEKLGKHTTGKGCIYIKKLADVDIAVLREMMTRSHAWAIEQNQSE